MAPHIYRRVDSGTPAINITLDNKKRTDTHHRYWMPPLETKIEGKGNGIKTILVNVETVAIALERRAAWVHKYLGIEVGATTPDADKTGGRHIINGAHDAAKLQELLEGFMRKFVFCPCGSPETEFKLQGKKALNFVCRTCPRTTPVPESHKVFSKILKDVVEDKKRQEAEAKAARRAGASAAADEDSGNGGKDGSHENGNDRNSDADQDNDHNGNGSAAADEDPELVKLRDGFSRTTVAGDDDKKNEFQTDTSNAAAKERSANVPAMFSSAKAGQKDFSIFEDLASWIEKEAEEWEGGVDDVENDDIFEKVEELGIEHDPMTVQILVQTLFGSSVQKQIPKRAKLFKKVMKIDADLSKLSRDDKLMEELDREQRESDLLGGTERLLGVLAKADRESKNDIYAKALVILKTYYNLDLLSDKVARQWIEQGPTDDYAKIKVSTKVHSAAAKKFQAWLDTPDESDSD